ncbi:exported hypothetical protein [Mesorhizobium plurifarium]|uniref:Uncharacterized protein n=1 Tax=Mesorhizobium plurifarium TaxID=69974 RepID=A0A090GBW8_MESPL|nr:exported hypothetical protein [Mesorhizobium plurifarium]
MTFMRCGAGCVPVSLTFVHASGLLRLTSGLHCAPLRPVAHQNHSKTVVLAAIGSTQSRVYGERGLDRPFREILDGLLFDSSLF